MVIAPGGVQRSYSIAHAPRADHKIELHIRRLMNGGGGFLEIAIADTGMRLYLQMLLKDNFIHADLHPGNILVRMVDEQGEEVLPSAFLPAAASEICTRPEQSRPARVFPPH